MTQQIELTQGLFTIVDNEFYDLLNEWGWHAFKGRHTHYAIRMGYVGNQRVAIRMHREILGLSYKDGTFADHINRDGLDNRLSNLRIVTNAENLRNHKLHSLNSSGHPGVSWCKRDKKWRARISMNYQDISLGYHSHIDDAIEARKQGEQTYW